MTSADKHDMGNGDEMIAAEYVLGVLSADERQSASSRIDRDPAFAQLVDLWEQRLSPLADAYQQVEVPHSVKEALNRRLFSKAELSNKSGFWSSLTFWRSLTAALAAALVVYIAVPHFNLEKSAPPGLVASLAADGSNVRYLVLFDGTHGKVRLSHISGDRPAERDFELWLIKNNNAPISIGIVPVGKVVSLKLSSDLKQKLSSGETFAISLEPVGGSPTGQPTGPIVAAGELKNI